MDGWSFLPAGYLITIALETPVLLLGLSAMHPWKRRLFAGLWLTACSYPIVVVVLPELLETRWLYLLVAETFAPLSECLLFLWLFRLGRKWQDRTVWRDMAAIVVANLVSFLVGPLLLR